MQMPIFEMSSTTLLAYDPDEQGVGFEYLEIGEVVLVQTVGILFTHTFEADQVRQTQFGVKI